MQPLLSAVGEDLPASQTSYLGYPLLYIKPGMLLFYHLVICILICAPEGRITSLMPVLKNAGDDS